MNLSIALGLGARSFVGGVPAVPSGLELGAQSLKFATGNLQASGQTSVIKQARTNLTNVLTADNSFIALRVYADFDRMNRNNLFDLLGNSLAVSTAGRMRLTYIPEAINIGAASLRKKFAFTMRRAAGTAYGFESAALPAEISGWYVITMRRTTGGVFRCDVWDDTGSNVAPGPTLTQTLGGIDSFNQTHFYIGDAPDVSGEPTTATARGTNNNVNLGWEGAIDFIAIGDVALSDADCEAIAAGADPFERIGASNCKFARDFGMDDTGAVAGLGPVAGSGDTTSAATVIGTFLPGGTPGRQGTTDFITLDPVPDYTGFGVHPDTLVTTALFEGSVGGAAFSGTITAPLQATFEYRREVRYFGGQVQGRFCAEDGTPVGAWQSVQTVSAPGVTNGLTFTENSRSAPAIKVMIDGQSQMNIWSDNTGLANTLAAPALSMARREVGSNNAASVKFQNRPDFGNLRLSDGFVEFGKTIRAGNGGAGAIQVVLNAIGGSNALEMINPANDWTRTGSGGTINVRDLLAYAGNDLTIDEWQWFTTHQAEGSAFGTNILDAVWNGTGPNATDRKLPDLYPVWTKRVLSPATRQGPTTAGPLDADPQQSIGGVRAAMRAWAAANNVTIGPEITDMRLDTGEGPHQLPNNIRGNPRIGLRMGEAVNRALGFSSSADPTIGTPRYVAGKAAFTLTVTLPNAGSTLRVDDTATYGSNVQGFEISTDGGTTWSRSGFTATFSGTTVTVTKTSGDWSAVAVGAMRVRYACGAPFGFGTSVETSELFSGGLYDGTALEGGLGLPVVPLLPDVVAEP